MRRAVGRVLAIAGPGLAGPVLVAGMASAQTVVVTNAGVGTPVELIRDQAVVGSAAVGSNGVATLVVPEALRPQEQMDGLVYVDTCSDRRRVLLVQRMRPAAPVEPGCSRQEISGIFVVRPISTLVINLGVTPPSLLLAQGPFDPTRPQHLWAPVPLGLAFSAGAGIDFLSDPESMACGTVTTCEDDGFGTAFTAGVAFWFLPYLGAEAAYLRPGRWSATGQGQGFSFTSELDAELLTVAGLAGVPLGPTRAYGRFGGSYHRATFSTEQTIDEQTVTQDGVTSVVQGGSQTIAYRTDGWGWTFGGGFEFWFSRYLAAYGDFNIAQLKGRDVAGGEAETDYRVTTFLGGLKLHLGRRQTAAKPTSATSGP